MFQSMLDFLQCKMRHAWCVTLCVAKAWLHTPEANCQSSRCRHTRTTQFPGIDTLEPLANHSWEIRTYSVENYTEEEVLRQQESKRQVMDYKHKSWFQKSKLKEAAEKNRKDNITISSCSTESQIKHLLMLTPAWQPTPLEMVRMRCKRTCRSQLLQLPLHLCMSIPQTGDIFLRRYGRHECQTLYCV